MDLTLESAFSTGGLVGHLSYLLLVVSMLMKRITWLRLLVISSALVAILYDWVWLRDPIGVFWESLLVTVNCVHLLLLHGENLRARFTSDEEMMLRLKLPCLPRGLARKFLNRGEWMRLEDGALLTEEQRGASRLLYIAEGRVDVILNGIKVSHCDKGDFIGEMSVFDGAPASATTRARGEVFLWRIDGEALRALVARHPEIKRELDAAFGRDAREKLINSNHLVANGLVG